MSKIDIYATNDYIKSIVEEILNEFQYGADKNDVNKIINKDWRQEEYSDWMQKVPKAIGKEEFAKLVLILNEIKNRLVISKKFVIDESKPLSSTHLKWQQAYDSWRAILNGE